MRRLNLKTSLPAIVVIGLSIICSGDILAFIMLMAAWAFHEVSHLLTSQLFGYRENEITITPLGGELKLDPLFAINSEAEFLIALSGPAANWLMVAAVLYLKILGVTGTYLTYWLKINLLLGWVNLIPALPLDGGRIVHACLNRYIGLTNAATVTKNVTVITGILLLGLGAVFLCKGRGGSLFIIISGFIFFHLLKLKKPQVNLPWKLLQHKKNILSQQGLLNTRVVLVRPDTLIKDVLHRFGSNDYLIFYLFKNQQELLIISEELAWKSLIAHGFKATFLETMKAGFTVNLQKIYR